MFYNMKKSEIEGILCVKSGNFYENHKNFEYFLKPFFLCSKKS